MTDGNELKIGSMSAALSAALLARSTGTMIATGLTMGRIIGVATIVAENAAPVFEPGNEPDADGTGHVARDGRVFYRPGLVVAARSPGPGPDVALLRDAQGVVRLEFRLLELRPAAVPPAATPFPVRVESAAVVWGSGRLDVPDPLLELASGGPADAAFVVRCGVAVPADRVAALEAAMRGDPACRVEVVLSYGYWTSTPHRPPHRPPPRPRPEPDEPPGRVITLPSWKQRERIGEPLRPGMLQPLMVAGDVTPVDDDLGVIRIGLPQRGFDPDVEAEAEERERRPEFRRVTLTRVLGFVFDPADPDDRLVYRGLHPAESVGDRWRDTGAGMVRDSGFPGTLFRLPDEVRLAFDPRLGTPFVVPTLYQDDAGENRVRVLLRALPWHDPRALGRMRDTLHAAPRIAVGGYRSATLRLTGAFPERLGVVGATGPEVPVTIENGVELALDVTLELYQLLAALLTTAIGVTGEVTVVMDDPAPGDPPVPVPRRLPVRLLLADPSALPAEVTVPPDSVSPATVTVRNTAGVKVRIGGCTPWLLQVDPNAAAPLQVRRGRCTTAFPLQLAPGASADLAVEPDGPDDTFWNAVQLDLLDHEPADDPKAVLDRVHELAPDAAYVWRIDVICPPLQQRPVAPRWAELESVEVEVSTQGFDTQDPVLDRDRPRTTVTMRRRLADVMRDDLQGLSRFSYRVRNVYRDRMGAWSRTASDEGTSLFAFPNDPATDVPPAEPAGPDDPPDPPVAATRTYTVKAGDSLWRIARHELGAGTRWPEILALNPGVDPDALRPGARLLLPA